MENNKPTITPFSDMKTLGNVVAIRTVRDHAPKCASKCMHLGDIRLLEVKPHYVLMQCQKCGKYLEDDGDVSGFVSTLTD